MNSVVEDMLMHYGMPRRSGRYPWGSGDNPYQHSNDFLGRVDELRKSGFEYTDDKGNKYTGDTAIAKSMGLTTGQFRTELALAKNERRSLQVATAKSLKEDGLGDSEIGRRMGVNESTVRSWLNEDSERRMRKAQETADFLKARMKEVAADGGMLDVGSGAELELNISKEKLEQALYILQREGYEVYNNRFEQVTNRGQWTTQRVLCPPGTEYKDSYSLDKIHTVKEYISRDGGETYEKKFNYPESMDSSRLHIRYNEEGGLQKDGIIELRRGVPDLSLGESRYSQVRILVDGSHYLKGMAVYSDDMPDGVDVIFNTNKPQGTPMNKVLKEIKSDPDNPFGSAIKDADQGGQYWYDSKTGERVSASHPNAKLGLINKRADEGDWSEWKDALPSQFLAKQSLNMVRKQLDLAKADKQAEYDDYCSLANPTIKKHYLEKFAETCDAAAVNLQAAALPGQKYHVIVPINSLKDTEVYAPGYENGTKLALVRYPHGGTFEIPILTVNNKNSLGRDILGTETRDAIGITSKVAEQLSGADFDGDTVMCIPTHDAGGKVKVSSTKYLDGLRDFDPKTKYGCDDAVRGADGKDHYYRNGKEYRLMTKKGTQIQMGVISNLITDMTLDGGASKDELAAAVRHSMVVIDAEKHHLDYKQSEIDNNIAALHKKYQGKSTGGASTILSKSKSPYYVDKRQGTPKTNIEGKPWYDPTKPEGSKIYNPADDRYEPDRTYNKKTGEVTLRTTSGEKITYNIADKEAASKYAPVKKVDKTTGEVTYTNKNGDISYHLNTKQQKSTKMAETDDAYTLVSKARNPKELAYAEYANSMKALANKARLEVANTGKIAYSKTAAETYRSEVQSLMDKLRDAELNKTRERAAQRMSNYEINSKLKAEQIDKSDVKKASQRALTKYRQEVGSISRKKRNITITDGEWAAIQAGAISESKLKRILNNTDVDNLRQRAMPKSSTTLGTAKINKIKSMSASNYSISEIAKSLGVSTSTVSKYLKGVN
jgi:DNA-binding CsgD family transcriptional regulator